MGDQNRPSLDSLQEKAKKLNCLYKLEELLSKSDVTIPEVCHGIVEAIPPGWQHSAVCEAEITLEGVSYRTPNFLPTPWRQSQDIKIQDEVVGRIIVLYTHNMPVVDDGPFSKEEAKLLETIANRLGQFIAFKRAKEVLQEIQTAKEEPFEHTSGEWRVILNLLLQTDQELYLTVSQKMLNQLAMRGLSEAENMLLSQVAADTSKDDDERGESNRPLQKATLAFSRPFCQQIFEIASKHLSDEQILASLQKWIQEDKLSFLLEVGNQNLPLTDVVSALSRYRNIAQEGIELPTPSKRGLEVALIRRFLTDQLSSINVVKKYISIDDFSEILERVIYTPRSHGKLGGKSAGLFFAWQIIRKSDSLTKQGFKVRVPKTWYITSDVLLEFIRFNHLHEVAEQKYKDISQIRVEYPHIIQTFKNRPFPPEIVRHLSILLDDMKYQPLIVRSSSLLEDRVGAAFSGKYKSLFLANRGAKMQRLEALLDAIAEVYASTFGPDPMEYRSERGLIDFHEEMGILIQEVVGSRVGDYYFPSFAGVAFSRNDFRWSPRIRREDGIVRLVPGLGTRAVDRLSDDYPILLAPGQPALRVNVTTDEVVRYSPKLIDVINLKENTFETTPLIPLVRAMGHEIPGIERMVSFCDDDHIRKPFGLNTDFEKGNLICTFDGLINDTNFIKQLQSLLRLLEESVKAPVDIEFASDGKDFYLLQCRAQSYTQDTAPVAVPKDIPKDRIIFTARKYVSNGKISGITHVVYVDPESYSELNDRSTLHAVGRGISRLNKLLPKRRFILMGPGRWGSRGDIKLGVSVTYSDINNTALLVEMAQKRGHYDPDLSFGTHFFQDLVEAQIRYLPLYPDEADVLFNKHFLKNSPNTIAKILPEFAYLSDALRLIDVPDVTNGLVLQILMNAELEEAVAFLSQSEG